MPDQKISQLTDGSPAQSTDQVPVARSGSTLRVNMGTIGAIQVATVTLTSAQLKALRATPVQLVAAPGAGKVIQAISSFWQYSAGATPYTVPDGSLVIYNATAGLVLGERFTENAAGFLDQAASQVLLLNADNTQAQPATSFANKALLIANNGSGEWTAGDGTVIVTVYYAVVTLS
jgi:hypothetical protein